MLPGRFNQSSPCTKDLNCVEVGVFKVSTLSGGGSSCVEVGAQVIDGETVVIARNSRHPEGACVAYTPDEWTKFVGGVKLGEFDL